MTEIVEIDGSYEEGGGQILRVALSLSAILRKPFVISNIRAGREKPGLLPQHLMGVRAMAEITNAEVGGASIGSRELNFSPNEVVSGDYLFDIGTAGSITLLAQSLVPALLLAKNKSTLRLKGGTHVMWSPTIDYYRSVFTPLVSRFGANISTFVDSFGWYPRGGGSVTIDVSPSRLGGVELVEKGLLYGIKWECALSNLKEDIADRQITAAREILPDAAISKSILPSQSPGTALTLWAEFQGTLVGSSALGKIGLKAEDLGGAVALELKKSMSSPATVDRWMSDQLLVFMALANGKSSIIVPELTPHMKSCLWLIPKFTNVPFDMEGSRVSVKGIGEQLG